MIRDTGYLENLIWEHSATIRDLYTRRCRKEVPEMDMVTQAMEILSPVLKAGESILDVGCGSGYFYHALRNRGIQAHYTGIDASPSLITIGKEILPAFGLPEENLRVLRIEDLEGQADHVICLNVLSNIDNYHRPLERILKMARRSVLLRESVSDKHAGYHYVVDKYLESSSPLKVHVNTYPEKEFLTFLESYGYEVESFCDKRTRGEAEMVIDYPHYWKFFHARRREDL